MKIYQSFLVLILAGSMASNSYAVGSGAYMNQTGVGVKALSHSAFAGVANDPSAVYYNPAGLTQVKGWQTMLGSSFLDFQSEHTTPAGKKDKMNSVFVAAPHFYLTYSGADSRWAYGFGVYSPFGLKSDWKDTSFAALNSTKAILFMYAINPSVAFRVSDSFSVGAGIDYFNIFDLELNQKVLMITDPISKTPTGALGDSKVSGDGDGWGYNLGALWRLNEKHSFGLSYRSQINVTAEGTYELNNLTDFHAIAFSGSSFKTDVSAGFKFPQSVLLGYGLKPNDRWTIFVDYEWVNWTSTEETPFGYANNPGNSLPASIPRDWKSTSNIGAGAEFSVNDLWDLRFGTLVYEQVIPSSTLESAIPDASRWALTLGSGFHFGIGVHQKWGRTE